MQVSPEFSGLTWLARRFNVLLSIPNAPSYHLLDMLQSLQWLWPLSGALFHLMSTGISPSPALNHYSNVTFSMIFALSTLFKMAISPHTHVPPLPALGSGTPKHPFCCWIFPVGGGIQIRYLQSCFRTCWKKKGGGLTGRVSFTSTYFNLALFIGLSILWFNGIYHLKSSGLVGFTKLEKVG